MARGAARSHGDGRLRELDLMGAQCAGPHDRALNPRHSGGLTLAWEKEGAGRISLEALYTGPQALAGTDTPNPYRTMSPNYVMFGFLVQRQLGAVSVFLNAENVTDRRLTRFQPLLLPIQALDGRWTTDAWGPLDGRVINWGSDGDWAPLLRKTKKTPRGKDVL